MTTFQGDSLSWLDQLSAGPLAHETLMTRIGHALRLFVPRAAIALLRECDDGLALLGMAAADGSSPRCPERGWQALDKHRLKLEFTGTGWRNTTTLGIPECPLLRQAAHSSTQYFDLRLPAGTPPTMRLLVFTSGEAQDLAADSVLGICLVVNNLLRRLERIELNEAHSWIDAEITRLAELQTLLRPASLNDLPQLELAVFSRPHRFVGGDYYDVSLVPTNESNGNQKNCAIALADVSGHGPSAATEAAMLDAVMRTYNGSQSAQNKPGPASVMTYINRYMFTRRPRPSFATAFLCLWQPSVRVLRYSVAGHPPPLLWCSRSRQLTLLPAGEDIPINILKDYQWTEQQRPMAAGDRLIIYTDGVTEAVSPAGRPFGVEQLRTAIGEGDVSPQALVDRVTGALDQHMAGHHNEDDQSLMVIGFR